MDMSWKRLTQTPAGHKSRTCFTSITFQPPSFGAASNCVLRYPFSLSVKFASTFYRANQRSVAKFESPLQPRTDETYKSKPWPVCFFQQAKFPLFFFSVSFSLAILSPSRFPPPTPPSEDHPSTPPSHLNLLP